MANEARPPSRWYFWSNLIGVCALAPALTAWFQAHFQPLFTQIVLVGGAFTLWALARLVWGIVEQMTGADVPDVSRRFLSQPGATRLLIVAAALFGLLWWQTGSLYFELSGAPAGVDEYSVEVSRAEGGAFWEPLALTAAAPLLGRPVLWLDARVPLTCRIASPAGYQPRDCWVGPRHSERLGVPADFTPVEMHLIRLIPGPQLFVNLPAQGETPEASFEMLVQVNGAEPPLRLDELRQEILMIGRRDAAELSALAAREDRDALGREIERRALHDRARAEDAKQMAASLSVEPRVWATLDLVKGDRLRIEVRALLGEPGSPPVVIAGPFDHAVTDADTQTIWLGGAP